MPPQKLPVAFVFAQSQADMSKERESPEPQLREKTAGGRGHHSVTRQYRDPHGTGILKDNCLFSPHFPPPFPFNWEGGGMEPRSSLAPVQWQAGNPTVGSEPAQKTIPQLLGQDLTRQDRTRGEGRRTGAVQVQPCDFPQPLR